MRGIRMCWKHWLALRFAASVMLASSWLIAPASIHAYQFTPPEPPEPPVDRPGIDGWDDDDLVPAPDARGGRRVMISVSIDHWVFGNEGTSGLELLSAVLKQKLASIKREYEELKPDQIEKLELAGRGDIKHFQDRLASLKARYPQNSIDQETLHLVLAEVQTLRQQLQSDHLFGNQSLLTKTLRAQVTTAHLTPKYAPKESPAVKLQRAANPFALPGRDRADGPIVDLLPPVPVRATIIEAPAVPPQLRDERYYRRLIQAISTSFDPEVPLREEQMLPLVRMLHKASMRAQIPLEEPDFILLRLEKLPESEYRAILDPEQWNCLRRQFDAAKLRSAPAAQPDKPPAK